MFSGLPDFFGLDIGTTAVRVVQLRGRAPNRTVFRYGALPLDQKMTNKSDEATMSYLADSIRELLVQSQITTRNVVVGLPTNRIFSAIREFDAMSASDFVKTLRFQIDMIVPGGAQDSKVDWSVLDANVKNMPKKEVFVCSTKNNFIEQRLEMLERINLNVLVFEPDVLALIRALASANSAQTAGLLVDIGFHDTDISIVYKNEPRLIRTVSTGIFHILKAVINSMRVDQAQGQQLLFQVGMNGGEAYKALSSAIVQTLDNVLIELRKSVSYFVNRYSDSQLSQLIVCGDMAYVPGFAGFLAQQTGLPTVLGDAWQNVVCPPAIVEELRPLSANFTVASGLAERQVI